MRLRFIYIFLTLGLNLFNTVSLSSVNKIDNTISNNFNKKGDNSKLSPSATNYKPSAHPVAEMVASSQPYVLHHSLSINQSYADGQTILLNLSRS